MPSRPKFSFQLPPTPVAIYHQLCEKGDLDEVQAFLAEHPELLKARGEFGENALHAAVDFESKRPLAVWLIEQGLDLEAPNVLGETPLFGALRQPALVELLLARGAVVNATNKEGDTPLHHAAKYPTYVVSAPVLLKYGALVNAQNKKQQTPLFVAVDNGLTEIVKLLLAHGADASLPGQTYPNPLTPLELATRKGNAALIALLSQGEQLPNPPDHLGVTPLHTAAYQGELNLVTQLLAGRHPDEARDRAGFTPLHLAALQGQQAIAQMLLEQGADPNAPTRTGLTALHLAACNGHDALIQLLVEHNGLVNAQTPVGMTPLHCAVWHAQASACEALLKLNADPYLPLLGGAWQGRAPLEFVMDPTVQAVFNLQPHPNAIAIPKHDLPCPTCGEQFLTDSSMTVLHGNPSAPTHNTDMEVTYHCPLCRAHFTASSYHPQRLWTTIAEYHLLKTHHAWAKR